MTSQERTTQTFETEYEFKITVTEKVDIPGNLDSDRPQATCYPAQRNEPPHVCPFFNGYAGVTNACDLAKKYLNHKLTTSDAIVLPKCMVG